MSITNAANIKELIGGTFDASQDALLTKLAAAADALVVAFLGYDPNRATYTERKHGNGGRKIQLDVPNVVSVDSVTVEDYTPSLIPAYGLERRVGWRVDDSGIIGLSGYDFPEGFNNVEVVYTAGFNPLPADIVMAATEIAALRYKTKQNIGIQSKTLAQETIVFTDKDMTASARSVLQEYAKVFLVP